MFVYQEKGGLFFHLVVNNLTNELKRFGSEIDSSTFLSLQSLVLSFEQGLRGNLPPSFFLSSIDPGGGKTQAIASFLKVWKSNGFSPEGSVLVGVQSKDEMRALIKRLDLDYADFACFTGDDQINGLGLRSDHRHRARVLLTTQQMIISRTKDRSFTAASDFHFEGAPRSLRIWDESLVLAQPIALTWSKLSNLIEPLKSRHRDFADELQAFVIELSQGDAPRLITVSRTFADEIGFILSATRGFSTTVIRTLENLRSIAGRSMWLTAEKGSLGRVLVGSARRLPEDFAPAIITDASGRVRGTYKLWEEAGSGELIRLPAKANNYSAVRFQLWPRSVGTDVLSDADRSRVVLNAVAEAMEAKPGERWLVLSKMRTDDLDVEADLRATLPPSFPFDYMWWGKHHGFNTYKDVKNVVVLGSNFYSDPAYSALAIAATGRKAEEVDLASLPKLKAEEFQHNFLQAVMRGNARNAKNGVAGECDVYVVASKYPGPAALLRATFPGCTVELWKDREEGLTGHKGALVGYLTKHFAITGASEISKQEVRKALGLSHKQALTRLLDDVVIEALAEVSVSVERLKFVRH